LEFVEVASDVIKTAKEGQFYEIDLRNEYINNSTIKSPFRVEYV
jgi:hypothetical protein